MSEEKCILGYWSIRGRAQVLRLLLAYTGLNWEDKIYTETSGWFGNGDKATLGFDFPNLPYLIKGNFKITESNAIAKYICASSKKNELLGKTLEDAAVVDMILSVLEEIFNPTYALFYSPSHSVTSEQLFNAKIKEKLELIEKYKGEKEFVLGYLTLVDFKLAEASYYFEKMYPTHYEHYPFLTNIRNSIEQLPEVNKYYQSANAVKGPFLQTYAKLQF